MSEPQSNAERLALLEADNRRLRQLLEQRGVPADLRHRLRHTVAVFRTIIRKSAETAQDLESYVAHVEDRMDALMRIQAAIDELGSVDLHTLLADELQQYGALEGELVTLSGPEVQLDPRSSQVLALAVHELAVNALEHGPLAAPGGALEVGWTIDSGEEQSPILALTWKERGLRAAAEPSRQGFGTEVLTRMLPYDLQGRTVLTFEPDGLRCTIHIPLRTSR